MSDRVANFDALHFMQIGAVAFNVVDDEIGQRSVLERFVAEIVASTNAQRAKQASQVIVDAQHDMTVHVAVGRGLEADGELLQARAIVSRAKRVGVYLIEKVDGQDDGLEAFDGQRVVDDALGEFHEADERSIFAHIKELEARVIVLQLVDECLYAI